VRQNDSYFSPRELKSLGFKSVGQKVSISRKASIYNPELMMFGNNVRIDDFCVLSGKLIFGNYIHITPFCLLAGGDEGIFFEDFSTCAYRCTLFTRSDDYTGETLANSTVPEKFRHATISLPIYIGKYAIVGANSVVFPGAHLSEGVSIGSCSLITKETEPWGIYFGAPAKRVKDRKKILINQASLLH